ncbi:poly-beta-1,6 N-acetyl-D-glucosamine synthase [compost metagenome]
MISPLVSVIIPAYNAEKTIKETLDSVFRQTYQPIEIIVVNDGSTDHTLEILKTYQDKIHLISTENRGVSHSRNLGFSKATGYYIQYLDADDLLKPEKLLAQVCAMQLNDADVGYGDWQRFTLSNGEIRIEDTIQRTIKYDIEIELFTDFWCPPAALLYSRRIAEKLKWNEHLPVIQDARYLLDAAILKGKFIYIPEIMAMYRQGQHDSLSQRNETAFVTDCFHNCKEVYHIWKPDLVNEPEKKDAIIKVLRYCINRLSVLSPPLSKEVISFLLEIIPNYIPKENGFLRFLSLIFGYKKAETIAGIKRRLSEKRR